MAQSSAVVEALVAELAGPKTGQSQSGPKSSAPVLANFSSDKLTIGGGVAIFHVASARVVVCYHTVEHYWFLPKGRRDANEDSGAGAEREGFEESGFRNRLLPIPLKHWQPQAHRPATDTNSRLVTEPIWTQFVPQKSTRQYILFWYIAETLPPDVESDLNSKSKAEEQGSKEHPPYQYPPAFPSGLTLSSRVAMEPAGYEPVRHENTGVGADEAFYKALLLPIEEAKEKLHGSIQENVVHRGWEAIRLRWAMESEISSTG